MSTTRIYREWCKRIDSGTMNKAQCQQFARAACTLAAGYRAGGKRTALTTEEARDLWDRIHDRGGVRLTDEHTAQGLAWLKSRDGLKLGLPDGALEHFDHFLFMGDADITFTGYWSASTPIWRIVLTDGRMIDYVARSWQSGGANEWWWAIDPLTGNRT